MIYDILIKCNLTILLSDSYKSGGGNLTLYSDEVEAKKVYDGDTTLDSDELVGDIAVMGGVCYQRKEV